MKSKFKTQLPLWLEEKIAAGAPPSGSGVHLWLFAMVRQLAYHWSAQKIQDYLIAATQDCGRVVSLREIKEAIVAGRGVAWQPDRSTGVDVEAKVEPKRGASKWSAFDPHLADRIIADIGATVAGIEDASRIDLSARGRAGVAEYLIANLFPGDPWLCVGRSMDDFMTQRSSFFGYDAQQPAKTRHDLHKLALIVPSPMTAQTGKTKKGKVSQHTLEATGDRRFIVAEFDGVPDKDRQASLIVELAKSMPLVVVLESGGKSLHSFFYVANKDEAHIRQWFDFAISIGADKALWGPSQFARLPGGTRHKPGDPTHGAFQRPFYFDPSAMEGGRK